MNTFDLECKIKISKVLTEAKKKELLDILKVGNKFRKNNKTTGADSNFFEQNFIKRYYPKFYKEKVSKRKSATDKLGLPKDPYVWMPRSA